MPYGGVFDLATKIVRADELEAETQNENFWNDQQTAQKKMQEMSSLRAVVETWDGITRRAQDALELLEVADDDPAMLTELEGEASALEQELDSREFELALSGRYDRGSA